MKEYIITIDAGTTNTRVFLFNRNKEILATRQSEIGVRNSAMDGNNAKLRNAVKSCLEKVVEKAGISYRDVAFVAASGMITSNVGLIEIEHLSAPAGLAELSGGIRQMHLPEICPIPIWFIPGIKNNVVAIDRTNYESMDVMRGEETEAIAMLEHAQKGVARLFVLPGSHTKFVSVDENGKITGGLTSLAGELLSCVTKHTILSGALGGKFVSEVEYDKEMLLTGYRNAKKVGVGRALFSCRILDQFLLYDRIKLANYILGAVLETDIAAVKNSGAIRVNEETRIVLAGKNPLKQAIADLLEYDGFFKHIRTRETSEGLPLAALGAYLIARDRFARLRERSAIHDALLFT